MMKAERILPIRDAYRIRRTTQGSQRGAALAVSLVFLLLLTLLGVTAVTRGTLQEKMSGNLRDQTMAFEASETVLRDGEAYLAALGAPPPIAKSLGDPTLTGVWAVGGPGDFTDTSHDIGWWNTNGITYAGTVDKVVVQPSYLIEERKFVPDDLLVGTTTGTYLYRVTGHGAGATPNARGVVQSVYGRRF
jgi:type IV pilus assembly protein PilX